MPSFLDLQQLLIAVPAVLVAITVHEYSHGGIAYLLGDPTARDNGRLTLNPLAHLDLIGALMLLIVHVGWAKPVPVNANNFANPRRDMAFVGSAGPLSNIITACFFGLFIRFVLFGGLGLDILKNQYLIAFSLISFQINLGLALFNLLPIPPLDGSQILLSFLPPHKAQQYLYTMRYVPIIFFILIVLEQIPGLHIRIFSSIFSAIFEPFFSFFAHIFFGGKASL